MDGPLRENIKCMTLCPIPVSTRLFITEEALNNKVDRTIHSFEISHSLTSGTSEHAQWASELSSLVARMEAMHDPIAGLPLTQADLGITTKCPVYQSKDDAELLIWYDPSRKACSHREQVDYNEPNRPRGAMLPP